MEKGQGEETVSNLKPPKPALYIYNGVANDYSSDLQPLYINNQ